MVYSKYFFPKETKVPTVAILLTILLLVFIIYKFTGTNPTPSKASKQILKQLKVVNPSQSEVGIYWQTTDKTIGWVIYGTNNFNLNQITLDERDIPEKKNNFYNHYALLRDLNPSETYYFKIVSNNQLISDVNNKAFSFKTAAVTTSVSSANPAYGKIIQPNGQPLDNAVVIISFANSYPLLTISKSTGEWLIPLNNLIDKDNMSNHVVDMKEKVNIDILSEKNTETNIESDVADIVPLPQTVIIGQNYVFPNNNNVLSASSNKNDQNKNIDIIFPKEGAVIPYGNPIIKGMAMPDSEITVTVRSANSLIFKVKADKDGLWEVNLTTNLSQGEHTITIVTKDSKNKEVVLSRKFTMAKSGEQVLGEATAEATPTTVPTLEPTTVLSPTVFVSPYPTQIISVTPAPPVTGGNISPFIYAGASLIILGSGLILAF